MGIAGVLGILFFVSSGRAQIENLLGLDMARLHENVETIENAFGKSLAKKLIQIANEVYAGTFTPQNALTFLEELTSEERDGAAQGIISLIQDLESIVSAPGTKDQLRMGLQLAPIIMKQVINSTPVSTTPAPTKKTKELEDELEGDTEPKKVDEVVAKIKPNETEMDETEVMDIDEIRSVLGNLMGTGKVPEEFLEIMEQLVNLADEFEDVVDTIEEGQALDDKTTLKISEIKNKLEGDVDKIERATGNGIKEESRIRGERGINEENEKDHDKDEL